MKTEFINDVQKIQLKFRRSSVWMSICNISGQKLKLISD